MLHKILTAVTALAVVASMLAGAGQAAAVSGYNSAYFGESAFLTLAPGTNGQFAVGFNNTGSTGWLVGSSSQVDLTVCQADKTTCNTTSPNAAFASGWLSSTNYATTSTTYVGPGQTGFFVYNVAVPAAQAAGTYRFNGDLALNGTASMLHQQGYYQDVQVAAPGTAPAITSLTPNTGSNAGGTSVAIAGTGFVCTPTTPTVNFGTTAGTVTSCGATSLTVTSPAGAIGTASVTVANAGGAASNGLDFIYTDTTKPVFNSITAVGNTVTLTFSETVCNSSGGSLVAADFLLTVNGVTTPFANETSTLCNGTFDNGTTTFDVTVTTPFTNGDAVSLTLTSAGGLKLRDKAGNTASAQTRTATAVGDTTKPFITAAAATSATGLKLTYSEPVVCTAAGSGQFVATPGGTATVISCAAQPGSTTVTLTFGGAGFTAGTGGSVTYTAGAAADQIKDRVGNNATTPQTIGYTGFSSDTTRPLSQDVRVTFKGGASSTLGSGDVFVAAFNEIMLAPTPNFSKLTFTDADGTVSTILCGTSLVIHPASNGTCVLSTSATTIGAVSYPAGQVITVTLYAPPTIVTAGTITGLTLPATVVDSLGFGDAANNPWDITNSPDKILN